MPPESQKDSLALYLRIKRWGLVCGRLFIAEGKEKIETTRQMNVEGHG